MKRMIGSSVPPQTSDKRSPTAFDFLTRLVVPLGFGVIAVLQRDLPSRLAAFGLVALSLLIGIYHPARQWFSRKIAAWKDRSLVRRALPELRDYVDSFGRFVAQGKNDTLDYVVSQEVYSRGSVPRHRLQMGRHHTFYTFWTHVERHATAARPTVAGFIDLFEEFNTLAGNYFYDCIEPIYESMDRSVRDQLTDEARASLEAVRERLVKFRNDYQAFAARVVKGMKTERLVEPYLFQPRTLPPPTVSNLPQSVLDALLKDRAVKSG